MSSMIREIVLLRNGSKLTALPYPQVRVPLNTARKSPKIRQHGSSKPPSISACCSEHGRIRRSAQNPRSRIQGAGNQFEHDVER